VGEFADNWRKYKERKSQVGPVNVPPPSEPLPPGEGVRQPRPELEFAEPQIEPESGVRLPPEPEVDRRPARVRKAEAFAQPREPVDEPVGEPQETRTPGSERLPADFDPERGARLYEEQRQTREKDEEDFLKAWELMSPSLIESGFMREDDGGNLVLNATGSQDFVNKRYQALIDNSVQYRDIVRQQQTETDPVELAKLEATRNALDVRFKQNAYAELLLAYQVGAWSEPVNLPKSIRERADTPGTLVLETDDGVVAFPGGYEIVSGEPGGVVEVEWNGVSFKGQDKTIRDEGLTVWEALSPRWSAKLSPQGELIPIQPTTFDTLMHYLTLPEMLLVSTGLPDATYQSLLGAGEKQAGLVAEEGQRQTPTGLEALAAGRDMFDVLADTEFGEEHPYIAGGAALIISTGMPDTLSLVTDLPIGTAGRAWVRASREAIVDATAAAAKAARQADSTTRLGKVQAVGASDRQVDLALDAIKEYGPTDVRKAYDEAQKHSPSTAKLFREEYIRHHVDNMGMTPKAAEAWADAVLRSTDEAYARLAKPKVIDDLLESYSPNWKDDLEGAARTLFRAPDTQRAALRAASMGQDAFRSFVQGETREFVRTATALKSQQQFRAYLKAGRPTTRLPPGGDPEAALAAERIARYADQPVVSIRAEMAGARAADLPAKELTKGAGFEYVGLTRLISESDSGEALVRALDEVRRNILPNDPAAISRVEALVALAKTLPVRLQGGFVDQVLAVLRQGIEETPEGIRRLDTLVQSAQRSLRPDVDLATLRQALKTQDENYLGPMSLRIGDELIALLGGPRVLAERYRWMMTTLEAGRVRKYLPFGKLKTIHPEFAAAVERTQAWVGVFDKSLAEAAKAGPDEVYKLLQDPQKGFRDTSHWELFRFAVLSGHTTPEQLLDFIAALEKTLPGKPLLSPQQQTQLLAELKLFFHGSQRPATAAAPSVTPRGLLEGQPTPPATAGLGAPTDAPRLPPPGTGGQGTRVGRARDLSPTGAPQDVEPVRDLREAIALRQEIGELVELLARQQRVPGGTVDQSILQRIEEAGRRLDELGAKVGSSQGRPLLVDRDPVLDYPSGRRRPLGNVVDRIVREAQRKEAARIDELNRGLADMFAEVEELLPALRQTGRGGAPAFRGGPPAVPPGGGPGRRASRPSTEPALAGEPTAEAFVQIIREALVSRGQAIMTDAEIAAQVGRLVATHSKLSDEMASLYEGGLLLDRGCQELLAAKLSNDGTVEGNPFEGQILEMLFGPKKAYVSPRVGSVREGIEQTTGRVEDVEDIIQRVGATGGEAQTLDAMIRAADYYLPQAAREMMADRLDQMVQTLGSKRLARDVILNPASVVVASYKSSLVTGNLTTKPGHVVNNVVGDNVVLYEALGRSIAVRAALEDAVQGLPTLVSSALPPVGGVAAGAAAGPVAAPFGVAAGLAARLPIQRAQAAYGIVVDGFMNPDVNKILNGGSKFFGRFKGKDYTAEDVRRIAGEEGVVEGGIARELLDELTAGFIGGFVKKVEKYLAPKVVEDITIRSRVRVMALLMKQGVDPRSAAKATKEVRLNYATSTTQFERRWLSGLVMPFWTWRKANLSLHYKMMLKPDSSIARKVSKEINADVPPQGTMTGMLAAYTSMMRNPSWRIKNLAKVQEYIEQSATQLWWESTGREGNDWRDEGAVSVNPYEWLPDYARERVAILLPRLQDEQSRTSVENRLQRDTADFFMLQSLPAEDALGDFMGLVAMVTAMWNCIASEAGGYDPMEVFTETVIQPADSPIWSLGTEVFTGIDPGSETGRPSKRRISTTVGRLVKNSGMGDLVEIDDSDARYQGVQQYVVKDAAWWDLLSNITGLKQVDLAFQQAEELEARDDLAPNQKRRMLARIARAIGLSTQTSSVQTRGLFARYRADKEMKDLGLVDGPLDPQRIESQRMQRDEEENR
jgi:hypothetical protein